MLGHGLSFLFTVLLWWASTGLLIVLCASPARNLRRSVAVGAVILAVSLYGLVKSAGALSATNTYLSFLSALGVWSCLEMSFLMGYVTGPRRTPCPAGVAGWQRFRLALETLLYHELAIAAAAVVVVAVTWNAPNQTGTLAFLILMVMRISAKLNIFLGVPNLTDEFLPERLSYLKSYFRKSRVNLLFPVSILGATFVAVTLAERAFGAQGTEAIGFALLFTLVSLAILEHFFMVLPLPDAALWLWAAPTCAKSTPKTLP